MSNSQEHQQKSSFEGNKQNTVWRDNLSPESHTPNINGTAGLMPRPFGSTYSKRTPISEIIQMMKIDYGNSGSEQQSHLLTEVPHNEDASSETTQKEVSISRGIFQFIAEGNILAPMT